MSLIATAASASAASPVANLFVHGHRKGGHAAISESSSSPTSTQGLFSSLLQSLEQVIGIRATTSTSAAAGTTAAAGATAAAGTTGAAATSGIASIATTRSSGTSTPATANLSASFNSLMQGVNGNPATTGSSTASTQTSNAALQNFLSNLLQSAQSGGAHSLNSVGANVNTNV
jgi:hypothetical protein